MAVSRKPVAALTTRKTPSIAASISASVNPDWPEYGVAGSTKIKD